VIPFLVAQTDVLTTAGPDLVPPIIRMTAGFLVVLAILAVLAWFMRKSLNARRTTGSMTVETALSLAPGQVSLVTELQPPSFGQAMAKATGEQVKR
jgi:heme/copper-type cytochrome/quinol oxidase subunit 2